MEKIQTKGRSESRVLEALFQRANEHRDYTVYEWLMDAALDAKAASIFPHILAGEGDVIVDAGSGTGSMAELAARTFRGAHVYALDISHELRVRAEDKRALIHLMYGDASRQVFPENSVHTKYYSTSGHEVESFGGEGRMTDAMESTFHELIPGGRVIVRDFCKPSRVEPVYMRILSSVGLDRPAAEPIDYSTLSTRALFDRFYQEFRGGKAFAFEEVMIEGVPHLKLSPEWAHEFYLRKDYTGNWHQEIQEKYTYWTLEQARQILTSIGYQNIRTLSDPNEWILKNRLRGKIALFDQTGDRLTPLDFPPTHMIITADKPKTHSRHTRRERIIPSETNYQEVLKRVQVKEREKQVIIGSRSFEVESTKPIVGLKHHLYRLQGQKPRVLKVIRPDTRNLHTAFVSMLQTVTRQAVLDAYRVPHAKIEEYDSEGAPYVYCVQEYIEKSVSAADAIQRDALREKDIARIAALLERMERDRQWQLDMNPFSWVYRQNKKGERELTYVSGKVYRYDERWRFSSVGLWQWIEPEYIKRAEFFSAAIPTMRERAALQKRWEEGNGPLVRLWRTHLPISLWP